MRWKSNVKAWHRWLGLLVSLQLFGWSTGGFMFSILDIDNVHGDWERSFDTPPPVRVCDVQIVPAEAIERAAARGVDATDVASLSIRTRYEGQTVYQLFDASNLPLAVVDARSGDVVRRISPDQAGAAALRDFVPEASVSSVRFLEGDPPLEYRGGPMPVYQIILNHPKEPHIYVSPVTGDVITRRNRPWRIFDFFWMLHTMDYRGREDFNHWLLSGMSLLAVLTSTSGLLMWGFRLQFRRQERRRLQTSP